MPPDPSERARELVRGAYDLHVHVDPDVVGADRRRRHAGRRFAELGLAGFGLKSHYTSTAERAAGGQPRRPGRPASARSR